MAELHLDINNKSELSWHAVYFFDPLLQVYSIRTRSRAVEIFTTCANLICAIEELEKVDVNGVYSGLLLLRFP